MKNDNLNKICENQGKIFGLKSKVDFVKKKAYICKLGKKSFFSQTD